MRTVFLTSFVMPSTKSSSSSNLLELAPEPRAFAVVDYAQAVEPFVNTDRLSATERAMLMGGACTKAYGWSPTKS